MSVPHGKYIGERVGGPPADEAEHFIRCPQCGAWFDMRDLGHVFDGGRMLRGCLFRQTTKR